MAIITTENTTISVVKSGSTNVTTVIDPPSSPTSSSSSCSESSPRRHQLNTRVHLQGNEQEGRVYLPLCAKPSFLALLEKHPQLLEDAILHTLTTTASTNKDVLIFIADGAVMEEAFMAMDRPARARRITSSVATEIEHKVNHALKKLKCSHPDDISRRIKGVVHWDDVAASSRFQQALHEIEAIMATDLDDVDDNNNNSNNNSNSKNFLMAQQIQHHIKTLVKNLFTQRVEKARKAGTNITNVFTNPEEGGSLKIRKGGKYIKRYNHLLRACLLELCIILVGLETPQHDNDDGQEVLFTEMRYLTNDPQGMTYIASCLEGLRKVLKSSGVSSSYPVLRQASSVSHGITFVEPTFAEKEEEKPSQSYTIATGNEEEKSVLSTVANRAIDSAASTAGAA